ncbi:hypothetical protein LUD75_01385 [Epilithonimonas sp. JDS]|uniref:hypothetical protein n=1 Tax=Epilithonimonas sp. JDS TaxID=2902797 RepID=UPI001E2ACF10|nr:hypothetical protein [Epilithonimonas sp. JDS]MCD9853340.1 hypothetical protein [Epilithonimonas sp. JDS]
MKKILSSFALITCSLYAFGQVGDPLGFTENKIDGGTVYKKYKDSELDSIVVGMAAVNYGNALMISKTKDEIRIINAADENSVIKIQLKNKKQVRTFFYKDKPAIIVENIDFDLDHLPKKTQIARSISNGIITSNMLTTNYQLFGNDNPDKTFKVFYRLDVQSDLADLDAIFENISDFFSQEDALLRLFYGNYADKFEPKALAYLETDISGKIQNGIYFDFKNKDISAKNAYSIYKDGKITKSDKTNLEDFQSIFIKYREETME